MSHSIREGWRLYYSDEGYPYYYNEVSGESEWALIAETSQNYAQKNTQYQVHVTAMPKFQPYLIDGHI
jgi:hypothetical protein